MRIFFDVDGVIMNNIHRRKGWIKRWDENLEEDLGIDPVKLQDIFEGWFSDVLLGKLDFERELERWLETQGYTAGARQVIAYWNKKDTNVNPTVYDAVKALSLSKETELFVATNQTHERAGYLWDSFGFKNFFKDIYYSARFGCLKKDAEFFVKIERELAMDVTGAPPLYFDDDERNIEASTKRGWNAVLVDGAEDVIGHPVIRELLNG